MDSFLPNGYKEPETSNYMQFKKEGKYTFRILGSAIVGYVYWKTIDKKRTPIRVHLDTKIPMNELEINAKTGKLEIPKVFWAFPVWNYAAEKIQILELTQKTIKSDIQALVNNPKWGKPTEYDIFTVRDDSTGKTTYHTMADPKEPIAPEITKAFKEMYLNLNALYEGKNPFESETVVLTKEQETQIK